MSKNRVVRQCGEVGLKMEKFNEGEYRRTKFGYTEDILNGSGCDIEPLSWVQTITKYNDAA